MSVNMTAASLRSPWDKASVQSRMQSQGGKFEHDPLSGLFLLLSFGDMRADKGRIKVTDKRRYLIIWVYDVMSTNHASIGNVFLKMKNYEVGA